MTFQLFKMRNKPKSYDEKAKEIIRKNITINSKGCWIWQGNKDKEGYARFNYQKKKCRVHRISYLLFVDKLITNYIIHHVCGNPSCVNPGHLQQITKQEHNFRGNSASSLNNRKEKCPKCGGGYTIVKYGVSKNPRRMCKPCRKLTSTKYYQTHEEERKKYQKRYQLKTKQEKETVPIAS